MNWMIGVGVVLGGLVAVIAVAGALLPKDHLATRRAAFQHTAGEVFAIVTGPPDWRPDVKKHERVNERQWREVDSHGQAILFEVVKSEPPSLYVTRIADDTLPFGGTWTYEIRPASGGGCELRITERGEVRNVIFRFLARFVFGHTRTMETYLTNLGRKLGETAKVEE